MIKYTIEQNGFIIHELGSVDKGKVAISADLSLEINKAGSLSFTVPPSNVALTRGKITKLVPAIFVYRKFIGTNNDHVELLWKGRVIESSTDMLGQVTFKCEGWICVLRDSILRPEDNFDSNQGMFYRNPGYFFGKLIDYHNREMNRHVASIYDNSKNFLYRVEGFPTEQVVIGETDRTVGNEQYYTILDYIQEKFLSDEAIGGFLFDEYDEGNDTIVYCSDGTSYKNTHICSQSLKFSENIIELGLNENLSELCTAVIPIGKNGRTLKDGTEVYPGSFDEYTGPFPSGYDFIGQDDEDVYVVSDFVYRFGKIIKKVDFPDIDTRELLMQNADRYIRGAFYDAFTFELTAIDLADLNANGDSFKVGWYVRVFSPYHDLDGTPYLCRSIEYNLCNPASNRYIIGKSAELLSDKYSHIMNSINGNFLGFNNFDKYANNMYKIHYGKFTLNGSLECEDASYILWKSYRTVYFQLSLINITTIWSDATSLYIGYFSYDGSPVINFAPKYDTTGNFIVDPGSFSEAYRNFGALIRLNGYVFIENPTHQEDQGGGSYVQVKDLIGKTVNLKMSWPAKEYTATFVSN